MLVASLSQADPFRLRSGAQARLGICRALSVSMEVETARRSCLGDISKTTLPLPGRCRRCTIAVFLQSCQGAKHGQRSCHRHSGCHLALSC
jgi:hypothetical protein